MYVLVRADTDDDPLEYVATFATVGQARESLPKILDGYGVEKDNVVADYRNGSHPIDLLSAVTDTPFVLASDGLDAEEQYEVAIEFGGRFGTEYTGYYLLGFETKH